MTLVAHHPLDIKVKSKKKYVTKLGFALLTMHSKRTKNVDVNIAEKCLLLFVYVIYFLF
jgi:hypothetical protein